MYEALVSRMKKASKSLVHAGPDLLDPALAVAAAPVISQKLESVEKHKKTAELANIEANLYAIGDSLLYYKVLVYSRDRNTAVRALLDCSASHTFVSVDFLKNNHLYSNRREASSGIYIRMPNREKLISRSKVRLPIALGS